MQPSLDYPVTYAIGGERSSGATGGLVSTTRPSGPRRPGCVVAQLTRQSPLHGAMHGIDVPEGGPSRTGA